MLHRTLALAVLLLLPAPLRADYSLTKLDEGAQPIAPVVGNAGTVYWHIVNSDGSERLASTNGDVAVDTRTLSEAGDFPVGFQLDAANGNLLVLGKTDVVDPGGGFDELPALYQYPGATRLAYALSTFPGIAASNFTKVQDASYDQDESVVFEVRQHFEQPQYDAIARYSGGNISILAKTGETQVPGTGGALFTLIFHPTVQGGVVFFYGEGGGHHGVYQLTSGGVSKVLESGDPLPGGGNAIIFDFSSVSFANQGSDVAVAIDGVPGGVYKRIDGTWSLVLASNTPIPGGVGNFFDLAAPALQGGRVMFFGGRNNPFALPLQLGLYVETPSGIEPVVDLNADFGNLAVGSLLVPIVGGRYWDGTKVAFLVADSSETHSAVYQALPSVGGDKVAQKCRAAIVTASTALVQSQAKALQKCEDGRVKGKILGTCPDQKTSDAILKAETKLTDSITKACCGKDKTCTGSGDDAALADIGWNIGVCPNIPGGSCNNTIATAADISMCLKCVSDAAVNHAITLYYGSLQPTDPKSKDKTVKALNKCQVTIGQSAARFLAAKSKALAKCWGTVNKAGSGSCPDAKTSAAIATAESKKVAAIKKTCQGPDKTFGTADDFTPTQIGFPATCLSVTPPGGSACGGPISSQQDLIDCVDCVTEFEVDCIDRTAAPALVSYPPECNPGVTPTATPTTTPTPTPTPTPTVTPTP